MLALKLDLNPPKTDAQLGDLALAHLSAFLAKPLTTNPLPREFLNIRLDPSLDTNRKLDHFVTKEEAPEGNPIATLEPTLWLNTQLYFSTLQILSRSAGYPDPSVLDASPEKLLFHAVWLGEASYVLAYRWRHANLPPFHLRVFPMKPPDSSENNLPNKSGGVRNPFEHDSDFMGFSLVRGVLPWSENLPLVVSYNKHFPDVNENEDLVSRNI